MGAHSCLRGALGLRDLRLDGKCHTWGWSERGGRQELSEVFTGSAFPALGSGQGMHRRWLPILLELSLLETGKQISKPVTTVQWKIP